MYRSEGEKRIAELLIKHKIEFVYEKKLELSRTYDFTKKVLLYPDFYILKGEILVEYFGLDDEDYLRTIKFKRETYSFNLYHLIEVYPQDFDNPWKRNLLHRIRRAQKEHRLWTETMNPSTANSATK